MLVLAIRFRIINTSTDKTYFFLNYNSTFLVIIARHFLMLNAYYTVTKLRTYFTENYNGSWIINKYIYLCNGTCNSILETIDILSAALAKQNWTLLCIAYCNIKKPLVYKYTDKPKINMLCHVKGNIGLILICRRMKTWILFHITFTNGFNLDRRYIILKLFVPANNRAICITCLNVASMCKPNTSIQYLQILELHIIHCYNSHS